VNDHRFFRQTLLLRDLHAYLLFSGLRLGLGEAAHLRLGAIKHISYSRKGPCPTPKQWEDLDIALEALFVMLDESQRRKFLLSQFPAWMPRLAVACLVLVCYSLGAEVLGAAHPGLASVSFGAYIIWLTAMGALGAISFIAMNVLSVQEDVTFDLTSSRLLAVRVIVGALFGLVLSLPFTWEVFLGFGQTIARGMVGTGMSAIPQLSGRIEVRMPTQPWNQALYLLLPFLLGFSTTLVILILNRLLDGVQAIFGRQQLGRSDQELRRAPMKKGRYGRKGAPAKREIGS